jgi:hypothetical protein
VVLVPRHDLCQRAHRCPCAGDCVVTGTQRSLSSVATGTHTNKEGNDAGSRKNAARTTCRTMQKRSSDASAGEPQRRAAWGMVCRHGAQIGTLGGDWQVRHGPRVKQKKPLRTKKTRHGAHTGSFAEGRNGVHSSQGSPHAGEVPRRYADVSTICCRGCVTSSGGLKKRAAPVRPLLGLPRNRL